MEFGSGDGSQLQLTRFPLYVGVDVSRTAVENTRQRYADEPSKTFIHVDELNSAAPGGAHAVARCRVPLGGGSRLRTVHVAVIDAATRYVIVYSSNDDRAPDSVHVRHRKFAQWVENTRPDFRQCGFVANPFPESLRDIDNTSFADFYFFERVSAPNPNA